ncbi:MAG: protein-glutamate O-methyltransferase CheR [Firmicutes bacterium]|nr:protein-glutamate O-methyltransferase CheR [Bacillota bacterium]
MEFGEFKKKVLATFRLDLNSYKEKQLKRRLDSYLGRLKLTNYGALYNQLAADSRSYEKFLDYLTINVSEFFRDPQRFADLQNNYLPRLAASRNRLKIWSAACSNGSEPYSIAIILEESGFSGRSKIIATDIDKRILHKAETGQYSRECLKNVSPERMKRYFSQVGKLYAVMENIKHNVTFRHHDLLSGDCEQGFDLIVCRNVTIYFTKEAQDGMYKMFNRSLSPGGILFIGGSEMIFNYRELGFEKLSTCFYQKDD